MADGRGGPRQPARPAAVSNPGSGRRTDGGAGNKSQPIRVASGGAYGERKAAVAQQQAAPMATGPTGAGPGGQAAPTGQAGGPLESAFGPTSRPAESMEAGLGQPSPMAQNPQATLRALYAVMPHPNIKRMLDQQPGDIR